MASNAKKWTNEESLRLAELYRAHPIMWNPQHIHYYNQKKKRDLWKRFAEDCGVTMEEAKRKMFSMITHFKTEVMKSVDRDYTSRWFAFKTLSCLRNRESRSLTKELIDDEESNDEISTECVDKSERSKTSPAPLSKEEIQARKNTEVAVDMLKFAAAVVSAGRGTLIEEHGTFADHIARKLSGYNSRTRAIVERHIDNILFQADMGDYQNSAGPTVPSTSSEYQSGNPLSPFLDLFRDLPSENYQQGFVQSG